MVKETKYAGEMLITFAESHQHFRRIRLIDSRGMERMSLDNETEERPGVLIVSPSHELLWIHGTGWVPRTKCNKKATN